MIVFQRLGKVSINIISNIVSITLIKAFMKKNKSSIHYDLNKPKIKNYPFIVLPSIEV